jgi:hypothetical protein
MLAGALYDSAPVQADCKALALLLVPRLPVGGVVKAFTLSQLNAQGRVIKTKSITGYLEDAGGTFILPAGQVLAPVHNVVELRKIAPGGPSTKIQLRGVLTSGEVDEFTRTKVAPGRFTPAPGTAPTPANSLAAAIFAAANTPRMKLHLPDRRDDGNAIVKRPVTGVVWAGISKNDLKKVRRSADTDLLSGVQKEINRLGRAARAGYRKGPDGQYSADAKDLLLKAKQEAIRRRDALPIQVRVRVKMPAIFNETEL